MRGRAYERDKFERANWEKFRRGRRLLINHSLYWPVTDILCGLQMLAGYIVGAQLVMAGTITLGDYVAYVGLLVWLIWPMRNLGRLIVQMSTGLVSYGRVIDVIKEEREPLTDGTIKPIGPVRGALGL